ncbi:MAG: CHAT domain-containing protein [Bacteroidota bacterium]
MRIERHLRLMHLLCALVLLESPELFAGDRISDYLELRRLIGKEQFSEAIERCKDLIEVYPDYFYLYETLAEVSQYAGDLDNAAEYFEERIEEGREIGLSYYGLARVHHYKKNYRTAVLSYHKAIELGLDVPECYAHYAHAYEKLQGVDSAIRYFSSLCHRHPENANYWYALAVAHWPTGAYERVLQCVEEALSRRKGERRYLQARAAALLWEGRVAEGAVLLKQLLPLAQVRGDIGRAQFLRWYASFSFDITNVQDSSVAEIQEAIKEAREFGQFRWLGWGFRRLAQIENNAGNYENGLIYAQKAVDAYQRANDDEAIISALNEQFGAHIELGNFEEALDGAFLVLRRARGQGNERRLIHALADIAWTYHEMGVDESALDYAIEALSKAEGMGLDPWSMYNIHTNLGMIYEGLRNYQAALHHYMAAHELIPDNKLWNRNVAITHGNLGNAYLNVGDLEESKAHFHKQLALARSTGFPREEAYALAYLGDYYFQRKQYDLAHRYYEQGLRKSQSLNHAPISLLCTRGLAKLAEVAGKSDEALAWYQMAITTSGSLGHGQKQSFARNFLGKNIGSDYQNCVRILCSLEKPDEAFETAEKAKIQTGANLITMSQRKISDLLSDPYRARILRIKSDLERKHAKLAAESDKALPEREGETELAILSDIANLEIEYRKILDSAKTGDPRFYTLLSPAPVSLRKIQEEILGADQALLEYSVGEHQTEAFLVKRDTLLQFTVERSRAELSKLLARMSHIHSEETQRQTIWNPALANFDTRNSLELYRLLVGPIEKHLENMHRIIIVADDLLKSLPFEALVTEVTQGADQHDFSNVSFLIERYELSYAPAASLLDPRFQAVKQPRKLILAVGNPTVRDGEQDSMDETRALPAAVTRTRFSQPLPGAEQEVNLIGRIFQEQADVLVGDQASKVFFKQLAPEYKILHIAAHATFDNYRPLHSSVFLAADAETNENGVLRAFEFFNLELNAELAVLSACNTVGGGASQGMEGLVRGLVFAGVPSVVATLWTVEDESTAKLMEQFYRYLRQGERKSRALQLAKLDLIKSGKADPFYWAGFVLIGDSSSIDLSELPSKTDWSLAAVLGLVAALIQIIVYRKVVRD